VLLRAATEPKKAGTKDGCALQVHFPQISNAELLAHDVTEALKATDLVSPAHKARVSKFIGPTHPLEASEPPRTVSQIVSSLVQGATQQGRPRSSSRAAGSEEVIATYLPAADQVLLSRNGQLKLVSREAGGRREFFEDPTAAYFGNLIREPSDVVHLFLAPSELKWLVDTLDWNQVEDQHLVAPFLEKLESDYDGRSVRAPFLEALFAVRSLARAAIK